jgi:peptide deformylase
MDSTGRRGRSLRQRYDLRMTVDPSTLAVLQYPSPVLRRKAAPIAEVTDEVRAVAARMIDLMYEHEGIGLAAPQVGLSWRLFVTHVPPGEKRTLADVPATCQDGPVVYINPAFLEPKGQVESSEEGCLSLPDIRGNVLRPPVITISATGVDGNRFSQVGGGLLARCWQHENDHLDGVLIIDRMSQLSRLKNRSAIRDLERAAD